MPAPPPPCCRIRPAAATSAQGKATPGPTPGAALALALPRDTGQPLSSAAPQPAAAEPWRGCAAPQPYAGPTPSSSIRQSMIGGLSRQSTDGG
eukprot:356609-Chlamydomonas_euryale.AAC.5